MENKDYSYKKEQEEFYNKFKDTLMNLLQPVVENLVNHIRLLEHEERGKGKTEIDRLLMLGDINQPMYDILSASIEDLTKEYDIKLEPEKYFKNTNLN